MVSGQPKVKCRASFAVCNRQISLSNLRASTGRQGRSGLGLGAALALCRAHRAALVVYQTEIKRRRVLGDENQLGSAATESAPSCRAKAESAEAFTAAAPSPCEPRGHGRGPQALRTIRDLFYSPEKLRLARSTVGMATDSPDTTAEATAAISAAAVINTGTEGDLTGATTSFGFGLRSAPLRAPSRPIVDCLECFNEFKTEKFSACLRQRLQRGKIGGNQTRHPFRLICGTIGRRGLQRSSANGACAPRRRGFALHCGVLNWGCLDERWGGEWGGREKRGGGGREGSLGGMKGGGEERGDRGGRGGCEGEGGGDGGGRRGFVGGENERGEGGGGDGEGRGEEGELSEWGYWVRHLCGVGWG